MGRNDIFVTIHKNAKNDPLSDFINNFEFVPNSFGHQIPGTINVCDFRVIGDFEIIFNVGGQSNITIGGTEYICFPGDIVLIPPFVKHMIQTPSDNQHNNYWMHFDVFPLYLQDAFISAILSSGNYVSKIQSFNEVYSLYRILENEMKVGAPGAIIFFKSILTQVITYILKSKYPGFLNNSYIKPSNSTIEILNRCTAYIKENVHKPIGITDLCSAINVSESYIYKIFTRSLRMSPSKFISMYKLKRAEEMIKTSNLSIKEISDSLGFSSPYYFSNSFKKFYNMSPRQYIHTITI